MSTSIQSGSTVALPGTASNLQGDLWAGGPTARIAEVAVAGSAAAPGSVRESSSIGVAPGRMVSTRQVLGGKFLASSSSGTSPAVISDDFPEPDDPITIKKWLCRINVKSLWISSSRPWKNRASCLRNGTMPGYGQGTASITGAGRLSTVQSRLISSSQRSKLVKSRRTRNRRLRGRLHFCLSTARNRPCPDSTLAKETSRSPNRAHSSARNAGLSTSNVKRLEVPARSNSADTVAVESNSRGVIVRSGSSPRAGLR